MKKNKALVTVLAVVGIGAAAYFLFLKKKGERNGGGGNGGGGNRGGGGGQVNQDFLPMANAIFDAMDGYGTNEETIETELKKLRSKSDWNALVNAFGTRTISSGKWNFQDDFTGNLPECLNDELDSSEIQSVNQILNKIGVSI